jgi:hypothetical protein
MGCIVVYILLQAAAAAVAVPYYPLYAIDSGHTDLQQQDYQIIATNFSYIQGAYTAEQLDQFRQADPKFKPVSYINSATIDALTLERAGRLNASFYRAGNLTEQVLSTDTIIKIHPVPDLSYLKPSTTAGNFTTKDGYVTFIRLGQEIAKIVDVTNDGSSLTVVRGFGNTRSVSHNEGDSVFAPVFNSEGFPGGQESITYTLDPAQTVAVQRLVNHTLEVVARGYSGSWFDLFSDHLYNAVDMGGKRLNTTWDFSANSYYTRAGLLQVTKDRLDRVWNSVHKTLGYYPVILANNLAACYWAGNRYEHCMQLIERNSSTRPLDGYCLEQFCGIERNTNPYQSGCDPSKLSFDWVPAEDWLKHVQIVMVAAQSNLPAFPMVAQAGCKSVKLEMIGSLRDKFENFAYASYLLAIEKPSGMTRLGIPAFYQSDEKRYAYVHPRYTWPIGTPTRTVAPDDIKDYQPHGHMSFLRPFTGGIVVVNPYNQTDGQVKLNGTFYDPVSERMVEVIDSEAQTGYILLKQKIE